MTSNAYYNSGHPIDKFSIINSFQNISLESKNSQPSYSHDATRNYLSFNSPQQSPQSFDSSDHRRLNQDMSKMIPNKPFLNSNNKIIYNAQSAGSNISKSSVLQSVLSNSNMEPGRSLNMSMSLNPQFAYQDQIDRKKFMNQNVQIPRGSQFQHTFFSESSIKNTEKLQSTGELENPIWILNPPAPESAIHLRIGHNQDFKSKTLTEPTKRATYMDHDLQQILRNRLKSCLYSADPLTREKTPQNIGPYCEIVPLENILTEPRSSMSFGLPSQCFKAWSPRHNRTVCLRRIILIPPYNKLVSQESLLVARQLIDMEHPNIIALRDIFLTDLFSDNFYDYHSGSSTLQKIHMSDPMKLNSFSSPFNVSRSARPHSAIKSKSFSRLTLLLDESSFNMLPENTIWSYLIQMVHAIRYLHSNLKRASGLLDPAKILLQDGTRILINCLGVPSVFEIANRDKPGADITARENMSKDLVDLGRVILCLACGTVAAIDSMHLNTSFSLLSRSYSPDLTTLIKELVSANYSSPLLAGGIESVINSIAPRAFDHITRLYHHNDYLERELLNQLECGRLFRLACKFQTVLERSDESDPQWSEVSDRYLLKLFRDFVFHQVDSNGAPFLDLAHIINSLNKMEAASPEPVCLVSRDSCNVIIVTYDQVRDWLEKSFNHLVDKQKQSQHQIGLIAGQHESVLGTGFASGDVGYVPSSTELNMGPTYANPNANLVPPVEISSGIKLRKKESSNLLSVTPSTNTSESNY